MHIPLLWRCRCITWPDPCMCPPLHPSPPSLRCMAGEAGTGALVDPRKSCFLRFDEGHHFPAISTDDMCCWLLTTANCKQAHSFVFFFPLLCVLLQPRDFGRPARRSARSLSTLVGPAPVSASAPTTHQPCEEFLHCNLAAGHGLARGLQQARTLFSLRNYSISSLPAKEGAWPQGTYISTLDLGMLAWRMPDWTGELRSDTCATSANPGS